MYRPGKPEHGPRLFGHPPPHCPQFGPGGSCGVPPPGHLPPRPCGTFSTPAPDSHFLHNRPSRGHFVSPHCSSFSIDRSAGIALGGRQQIVPPAEPPHTQVPQWNVTPVEHHPPNNSDAGEEFLRCIAANKPLPDYLKGNMAYNLADAFKSAKVLKEAVQSDLEFQKHMTRSKSRSRSCGRSRGKSRARSQAQSKSRARSRSRGRSKSRARGRSQARNKSRAHSRNKSRSHSRSKRSHVRHKSQVRRSKSRSSSGEKNRCKAKKRKSSPSHSCSSNASSSNNQAGNSLLEGLKLVMNSKELEERLPSLKDAILTIQASNESPKVKCERQQQHDSQENSTSVENDSMLLPHDRVGSDFSWLQMLNQEDSETQKANELEDEESFLYGGEDTEVKQVSKSSTTLFAAFSQIGEHPKLQEMDSLALASQRQQHQNKSTFSTFGDLRDPKQPLQITSSGLTSASVDNNETEKIKNILKALGPTDISNIMMTMQGQKEEKQPSPAHPGSDTSAGGLVLPALRNPNVRQALESLQSLIKATKEKRGTRDDIGMPQAPSNKHKEGDDERLREKQARMSKMESLMKELEGLMRQDGLRYLTPVIGFYCQKCEEFIGDLNSAENHATIHSHCNSGSKLEMDKHAGDKGQLHHFSRGSKPHPHPSDRRDQRDYSTHKDSGDHRSHRDYQRGWRDERDQTRKFDDNRSYRAGQESISLKDEMRKERMLITVSHRLTPPPLIRVKEVNKEQAIGSKVKEGDSKGQPSIGCKDKVKDVSSDSSDTDKGKTLKTKSPKKKKKKKEKDKKKKVKRNKS